MRYEKEVDVAKRTSLSKKLRVKYPERVPLIIQPAPKCSHLKLSNRDRLKLVADKNMTTSTLMWLIRNEVNIQSHQALFFFSKNTLVVCTQKVGDLDKNIAEDGFVYLDFSTENAFG